MKRRYVGAIDQGTTSTRFFIYDHDCNVVAQAQREHKQYFPQPGWVEHDAAEILHNAYEVTQRALTKAGLTSGDLAAIGVTNQRETIVAWDGQTAAPLGRAIVWQDARTAEICRALEKKHGPELFWRVCGLPVSTYFSAAKIKWLLENSPAVARTARDGRLMLGTMDAWLIWRLTGGRHGGVHATDATNASRTLLMDIQNVAWDEEMLGVFGVERQWLPEIRPSCGVYGHTDPNGPLEAAVPIAGNLGDQQAALFGQCCFDAGQAKNTYGTGCFLLLNTGSRLARSQGGLLSTVAFQEADGAVSYALEGSVAVAGSLVQWLRDNLGLIRSAHEIEPLARTVADNGGLYLVPAFSGLFAPHWDAKARGLMIGLTHYINKGHIARAALEAVAMQTWEVVRAMTDDAGAALSQMRVDGGMVENELLMQFQSDILDLPVIKPQNTETTVLGAAFAAGLAVGYWSDKQSLRAKAAVEKTWRPTMGQAQRQRCVAAWLRAVERAKGWLVEED